MELGESVRTEPAVSIVYNYGLLPDEILLEHVIPKLRFFDVNVFSCVDRRTRALCVEKMRCMGGLHAPRLHVAYFVGSVARCILLIKP